MVQRVPGQFHRQVFLGQARLARQARVGLQAPGWSQSSSIVAQLVERVETLHTTTWQVEQAPTWPQAVHVNLIALHASQMLMFFRRVEDGAFRGQLGRGRTVIFGMRDSPRLSFNAPLWTSRLGKVKPLRILRNDALVQMLEQLQEHAFIRVVIHRVTQQYIAGGRCHGAVGCARRRHAVVPDQVPAAPY